MTSDGLAQDEAALADYAAALSVAIRHAIPGWVAAAVAARCDQPIPVDVASAAERAGEQAELVIGPRLAELLASDIDRQTTTPLTICRELVGYATGVLAAAGAPAVARDPEARRLHPDDVYDLTPASFAVFGPDVNEAAIAWGAAKAHVHLERRRVNGLR